MSVFRRSSPKQEGILHVSKWIKVQLLLDEEEMEDLLEKLGVFYFVMVSKPVEEQDALVEKKEFLDAYSQYIRVLKQGRVAQNKYLRECFSCAMTCSKELFYAMPVLERQFLIKPVLPVIQMQMHQFSFSSANKVFYPMALGKETVSWGIQFSYPQFYQNPKTKEIAHVMKEESFPNNELFATLRKWVRQTTIPTPFLIRGEVINATIRIGKKCMKWIHMHPQLDELNIKVLCLD